MEEKALTVVTSLRQTCLVAPSQWEGALDDGHMFYIRVRHGRFELRISAEPTSDVVEAVGGPVMLQHLFDDPHESFLDEAAMMEIAGTLLDFSQVRG